MTEPDGKVTTMPKSRGRKHPKRTTRPRPAPGSWHASVLKEAASLLSQTLSRLQAELYASDLLGEVRLQPQQFGEDGIDELCVRDLCLYAARRRTPAAAALVAALATVYVHPDLDEALAEWAGPLVADLPWAQEPTPQPIAAYRAADAWDDVVDWLLEYPEAHLSVTTSRADGGAVVRAALAPPTLLERWNSSADLPRLSPVLVAQAATALLQGQALADRRWPRLDEEGYARVGHLLAARLRATGAKTFEVEWDPLPEVEREALLDAFFTEAEVTDDEVWRELADLCLTYGDSYISGGPLAWSPAIVEDFLLDWAPRKTVLDTDRQELLPAVTQAWVGWALRRHGLNAVDADDAAHVALEVQDEFLRLYDAAEKSPATAIVERLQAAGIDLTDKEAVDREISAYNAEQVARRALGK